MGIASIAAGFLESGPTIEWNDERLAMIRQALETKGGRRVTAGPRLTGADNLRAGRPGSGREADPLCTRPRARQRSRSVSEDSDARAEDAPRSAWTQPTSCRPDRTTPCSFICSAPGRCRRGSAIARVIDPPILNSLNLGAPSSLRTCSMTGVPGDLDDTELVDMSASYLASGLSAMSAESALCGVFSGSRIRRMLTFRDIFCFADHTDGSCRDLDRDAAARATARVVQAAGCAFASALARYLGQSASSRASKLALTSSRSSGGISALLPSV